VSTTSERMLIVMGGFAGSGKSTIAGRLSTELRIPRLNSDVIGESIRRSRAIEGRDQINAYWIAYDVLFALCEDFLTTSGSVIVDTSMGWPFQWQRLDDIARSCGVTGRINIVLRCPLDICLERLRQRHAGDCGEPLDVVATYVEDPKLISIWRFLEQLARDDVDFVDASADVEVVYRAVLRRIGVRTT